MVINTDICILGGGIMGLSTAYSISKSSDSKILLLDRYGIGNDYCSSNDINRVFRYSYGNDEHYTRMAVESLKLWKNLEKSQDKNFCFQLAFSCFKERTKTRTTSTKPATERYRV